MADQKSLNDQYFADSMLYAEDTHTQQFRQDPLNTTQEIRDEIKLLDDNQEKRRLADTKHKEEQALLLAESQAKEREEAIRAEVKRISQERLTAPSIE